MSNYKYSTISGDFVLTKEEHEECQRNFKKGVNTMSLRRGEIGINMATASWKPTDELTDLQIMTQAKFQKMIAPPEQISDEKSNRFARMRCEYRTKVGWHHTELCYCGGKVLVTKE